MPTDLAPRLAQVERYADFPIAEAPPEPEAAPGPDKPAGSDDKTDASAED